MVILTSKIIVIGVENSGNVFSNISVNHRIQIVTIIKEFQVEIHRWFSWPQSHGIDTIVIVTRNWVVKGHSQNPLVVNPDFAILVLFVGVIHTFSEKFDLHAVFRAAFLPWIAISQPIIGLLNLIILKILLIKNCLYYESG